MWRFIGYSQFLCRMNCFTLAKEAAIGVEFLRSDGNLNVKQDPVHPCVVLETVIWMRCWT